MKRLIVLLLLMAANPSWAVTYSVTSGNWISQQTWNTNNSAGRLHPYAYDNGEPVPPAFLNHTPGILPWMPSQPPQQDGTYSGSLIVDQNNVVVGGWLSVDGSIANEIQVNGNSWWVHQYIDLYIDFGTGTATSTYNCYETLLAPATCSAGGAGPAADVFAPLAGNNSASGTARYGAIFDGSELVIFHEGYTFVGQSPGTDYENTFVLVATVVPIPAAAWLFGSALMGLGWMRQRAKS